MTVGSTRVIRAVPADDGIVLEGEVITKIVVGASESNAPNTVAYGIEQRISHIDIGRPRIRSDALVYIYTGRITKVVKLTAPDGQIIGPDRQTGAVAIIVEPGHIVRRQVPGSLGRKRDP